MFLFRKHTFLNVTRFEHYQIAELATKVLKPILKPQWFFGYGGNNLTVVHTKHNLVSLTKINEICEQKRRRDCPKFCKLLETIWLTVINEIFAFPQHLDHVCLKKPIYINSV